MMMVMDLKELEIQVKNKPYSYNFLKLKNINSFLYLWNTTICFF